MDWIVDDRKKNKLDVIVNLISSTVAFPHDVLDDDDVVDAGDL